MHPKFRLDVTATLPRSRLLFELLAKCIVTTTNTWCRFPRCIGMITRPFVLGMLLKGLHCMTVFACLVWTKYCFTRGHFKLRLVGEQNKSIFYHFQLMTILGIWMTLFAFLRFHWDRLWVREARGSRAGAEDWLVQRKWMHPAACRPASREGEDGHTSRTSHRPSLRLRLFC